jgi:hypothetical protein
VAKRQAQAGGVRLVLLAAFLVACGCGIVVSRAQGLPPPEREFNDTVPKHLPLKLKLKNVEKVKSLANEDWLRDLEIEVENTSNKPIYFLLLMLVLDDVTAENNNHIGFPLRYGRGDLVDGAVPLESSDVPIRPGETYTFKIPEDPMQGWLRYAARVGLRKSAPRKIRLKFQLLNFGDGTGFGTTQGVPIGSHEKQPLSSCIDTKKQAGLISAVRGPADPIPDLKQKLASFFLPAQSVPVNFSPALMQQPLEGTSVRPLDTCCPGPLCSRLKLRRVTSCGEIEKAFSASCTEPFSMCGLIDATENVFCNDAFGTYCIADSIAPCTPDSTPPPTPTPTPPPDGTPPPTPTLCPSPTEADYGCRPNEGCRHFDGPDCLHTWACDPCALPESRVNFCLPPQDDPDHDGCPDGYYNPYDDRYCCVPYVTPTPTPTPSEEQECAQGGGYWLFGNCHYSVNQGCTPDQWGFW